ncbi:MAG: Holliday junction resolvase RuvX [Candidatus Dadabacteria bacterium]|nr:Holliday junction resolvase RuvX [Candidatus Dadabacteria bacterium]MDE0476906.1 Holliday junction resolvase RuvX [Candidatus Dadabacteria bacterium]MXW44230.1 Holliday junction resolvase RuvX [Candidatus Dadabacteria bacterium]MXZ48387.1 Holliday junction resolvase RuvX [Candidatus Dadabacteria bacterium]MYB26984.1 Holliday junction resolvase RuvX [Candidatus Dadabacteria bacterium]
MKTPAEKQNRTSGRIISLDIGTKTIGVAVSDELGITANGVCTISRENEKKDLVRLRDIIEPYSPCEILVGIPYNQDGSLGNRAKNIRKFSERIRDSLGLSVKYWDESFSTRTAEQTLIEAGTGRKKRKTVIDKMAATIILEEYLLSRY